MNNLIKKQLFLDISALVETDAKSGIQRVVRSILLELLTNPPKGYDVKPIYSKDAQTFYHANKFIQNFLGRTLYKHNDIPITYEKDDVFLGLDLSAHLFPAINPLLQKFKDKGVNINYVIYDLTPLQNRGWHTDELVNAFTHWIDGVCEFSEQVICISDAVTNDVKTWISKQSHTSFNSLKISHFHLGADVSSSLPSKGMPDSANKALLHMSTSPSFLMVNTLEPRKGVSQTIEAFERLWKEGEKVNLIIVGKPGWHVENIINKIENCVEFNKRLIWLEGISDEYLEKVYKASVCLIAASESEGFGLPLIEAAQYKMPIIARNIPVFREVAGEFAYYFEDDKNPVVMARAIKEWLELYKNNQHPKSDDMPFLTWKESTNQLINCILEDVSENK